MTSNDGSTNELNSRTDFWFGLGLVILGLVVTFESWRMPRLADLNVHPMTAPGLVPGMIGIAITGLGAVLFIRSARAGGWHIGRNVEDNDPAKDADLKNQARRFAIALVLCVGYAAGLVGAVPFWAATFTFVFLFVAIFEWQRNRSPKQHLRAVAMAGLLAVIVSGAVTYIFEQIFLVRLP